MWTFQRALPLLALLAGVMVFADPPPARADFQVMIQESGFATQTFTWDGVTRDANGNAKISVSNAAIGDFTISMTLASSNSTGGQNVPNIARLGVGQLEITNTAATNKTLKVFVTDTGFKFPVAQNLFGSSTFSATVTNQDQTSHVSYQGFASKTNVGFDTGDFSLAKIDLAFNQTGGLSSSNSGSSRGGPFTYDPSLGFSITDEITYDLGGGSQGGADTNGDSGKTEMITPEPATVASASLGLSLLGAGRWLKRRKGRAEAI